MMALHSRAVFRSALAAACLLVPRGARAQTTVQLEAGGSELTGGYGGVARLWRNGREAWVGAGYQNGLRLGAFGTMAIRRDTLRVGFDRVRLHVPTDVLGGGGYVLTQGLGWQHTRRRSRWAASVGGTGTAIAAPFVSSVQSERVIGSGELTRELTSSTSMHVFALAARTQTALSSVTWRSQHRPLTVSSTGGVGANRPYGAASLDYDGEAFRLTGSFVQFDSGFRRADAPGPQFAEPYRENVLLTLRPLRWLSFTAGRNNYVAVDDTSAAVTQVATLNQASLSAQFRRRSFTIGMFDSRRAAAQARSGYARLVQDLGWNLTASVAGYGNWVPGELAQYSATLELEERLSPTFGLQEVVSHQGGATSASVGGHFQFGMSSVGLEYVTMYVPFRQPSPFMRTAAISLRLSLGDYATRVSTSVLPDGRVTYTASGSTFMYLGGLPIGAPRIVLRLQSNIVRGVVRDTSGAPIEAAALRIGGDLVITNSMGEFFTRTSGRGPLSLTVSFDEFMAQGNWEVVSAPPTVTPQPEDRAVPVVVVLRRVVPRRE